MEIIPLFVNCITDLDPENMLKQRTSLRLAALLFASLLMTPAVTFAELLMLASITEKDQNPLLYQQVNSTKPILPKNDLPDFGRFRDVKQKKEAFFHYLLPMIRQSNERIRKDRSLLLGIREALIAGTTIGQPSSEALEILVDRYKLTRALRTGEDLITTVDALLLRVDVVPASLVLAQAANESGWGTSRFAREANNLFGTWCFTSGCGLAPRSREAGLTHEVARYDSVQQGIDAYIRNINTHRAYRELRQIRADSRNQQLFSGVAMAEGLLQYSARGEAYVREIQQMIRSNNLQRYTLS